MLCSSAKKFKKKNFSLSFKTGFWSLLEEAYDRQHILSSGHFHLTKDLVSVCFSHCLPLGDWQLLGKDHRPKGPHSSKSNIKHTSTDSKPKQMNKQQKNPWFSLFRLRFSRLRMYIIHQLKPFLGTGCRKVSTSPAHLNFCRHDQVSCLGKLLNSNHLHLSF